MTWLPRLERLSLRLWRRISPLLILLAAFALRIVRLGDANLWWDEALAIWAVRKGLAGVTLWTAADVHPPLYFWSLRGWVQAAGESEFAMRLLSVMFGVLTVAVVYRLGLLIGGRGAAILAGLLTALSRFHIWWSQEMRMYVLAGLLGALSLYLCLRWLRTLARAPSSAPGRERRWLLLIGYVLAALGSLYTIFLMAAWVLVQNLVVLIALLWRQGYRRGRMLLQWVAAQVAILAGLAVWLVFAWERMPTWSVSEPVSPLFVAELYAVLLTAGASVEIRRYLWSLALPLAALVWGMILLVRRTLRGQASAQEGLHWIALSLAVAAPPVMVYLSTLPRSLFYTPHIEARYFLPFAAAFWALLAWAVAAIGARWRRVAIALGAALVLSWLVVLPGHYADRYLEDELQTLVRTIASQAETGDVVLLNSGSRYPVFLYYYGRLPGARRPEVVTITQQAERLDPEEVAAWFEEHAGEYRRIWLAEVEANLSDPERLVRAALQERYVALRSEGYGHNALYLYAGPNAAAPRLTSTYTPDHAAARGALFGALRGWELPVRVFTPGHEMRVVLYWDRSPLLPVTLELVNAQEQVLQRRRVVADPRAYAWRERVDLPVTPALAEGNYSLQLVVEGEPPFVLGQVRIADTLPLPAPQGPEVGLELIWGEGLLLEGLSLAGAQYQAVELAPGDTLVVDLYWRVQQAPQADYTVFVHLIGEAFNPATQGPVWGQHDAQPLDGLWPTRIWRTGETLVDRHLVTLDPATPPGNYSLVLGLYATDTVERLTVTDRRGQVLGDHLRLGLPIQVRER
jgi:4-amino-4-deoxy-L-arabinose transferase-like glycosyltransferase